MPQSTDAARACKQVSEFRTRGTNLFDSGVNANSSRFFRNELDAAEPGFAALGVRVGEERTHVDNSPCGGRNGGSRTGTSFSSTGSGRDFRRCCVTSAWRFVIARLVR